MKRILKRIQEKLYLIFPFSMYLRIEYFVRYKSVLHLKNPKRFSEKIFWLRNYYEETKPELLRQCYDKITVREYIVQKLGESYCKTFLNRLLKVYETPDDIDLEELPNRFVLKVSQSSGYNIICANKQILNWNESKKKLSAWLTEVNDKKPSVKKGFVFDGNARILCEQYLSLDDGTIPYDLRIYCFNGEPKLFVCDIGTTKSDGSHGDHIIRNVYDLNWNLMDIDLGRKHDSSYCMDKPENLEEIIAVAKKLSEDFIFVRVDVYNVQNRLIFGELTWIPMGGYCLINPSEFDELFGEWLKLPLRKSKKKN